MVDAADTILDNPSILLTFQLLTFSDLKAYKFTYWVGVPAVIPMSTHGFMTSSSVTLKDWMLISSSTTNDPVVDVMNENQLCIRLYRKLIHHLTAYNHNDDGAEGDVGGDGGDDGDGMVLQCIFGLYISNDINHIDHDDGKDDHSAAATADDSIDDNIIDVCIGSAFESCVITESNIEAIQTDNEEMMFINKPYQPWHYEGVYHHSRKANDHDGHEGSHNRGRDDCGHNDSYSERKNNAKLLSFKDAWSLRYDENLYFVIVDPSSSSSTGYGWIVRNLLAMLSLHLPERDIYEEETNKTARIISFRGML